MCAAPCGTPLGSAEFSRGLPARLAVIQAALQSCWIVALAAQDPGPTTRPYCEPTGPTPCERRDCKCTDSWLGVEFEASRGAVLDLPRFQAGEAITVMVTLDTPGSDVLGWNFGVRHDPEYLELESLTLEGTDARRLAPCAGSHLGKTSIEECLPDDPTCESPVPGSGFVGWFVIVSDSHFIPRGHSTIALAVYRLTGKDPGATGTLLQLTDRLKQKNTPATGLDITAGARTLPPRFLVDGLLRRMPEKVAFHRGDPSGDGRATIADALATLRYLLRMDGAPPCLEAADFDDDGHLALIDAVRLLQWLFLRGDPPELPGPPRLPCGFDPQPSPVDLGCAAYAGC